MVVAPAAAGANCHSCARLWTICRNSGASSPVVWVSTWATRPSGVTANSKMMFQAVAV